MPGKTLIITSCCKEKLDHPAPARDLYQGKLFKLVKQYAEESKSDWRILSAKHGLVEPDQVLEPYDVQITGRAQIDPLQVTVLPALAALWDNYERIIVIMGSQYLKVINPILKRQGNWKMASRVPVEVIHDERGIGGLMQRVKDLIKAADGIKKMQSQGLRYVGPPIEGCVRTGLYTRKHHPELCAKCPHHECTFDETRKAANLGSTPCDYCCIWENLIPDHLPCSQCGENGYLRRLKYTIVCDACHRVHEHLTEETKMAEQPKPEEKPEEKKAETKEPEPSEFGRICGGCGKPIKPGTKNMVQDPHTKEWFHAEHYGQDERHQDTSEDQYECIACSKEFPETEMHRDRDGETWCKPCWAAEHPPKKRAKKENSPEQPVLKCDACGAPITKGEEQHYDDLTVCKACFEETEETEDAVEANKAAIPGTKVPKCPTCNFPQTEEIYLPSTGFKRCTCKTPENKAWAGQFLYNQVFAKHFKEIKSLLDKDERERMSVLAEVLQDV